MFEGLSPPVRGNLMVIENLIGLGGTIPACAGEPRHSHPCAGIAGDYPCLCGGTHARQHLIAMEWGLSPPVRGNLPPLEQLPPSAGTIPACAGEPRPKYFWIATKALFWGLSPPVRGNRMDVTASIWAAGTIPACAGEPAKNQARVLLNRDYPRLCGGTIPLSACPALERGLSPPVRGNPCQVRTRHPI